MPRSQMLIYPNPGIGQTWAPCRHQRKRCYPYDCLRNARWWLMEPSSTLSLSGSVTRGLPAVVGSYPHAVTRWSGLYSALMWRSFLWGLQFSYHQIYTFHFYYPTSSTTHAGPEVHHPGATIVFLKFGSNMDLFVHLLTFKTWTWGMYIIYLRPRN